MVKVIGQSGASSLGFTPNTIGAFSEALECAQGFSASLTSSVDGTVFCIEDIVRNDDHVEYNLEPLLSEDSFYKLGHRRIDEVMADEVSSLRLKNGEKIVSLNDVLPLLKTYPNARALLKLRGACVVKDTISTLKTALENNHIRDNQIIVMGYDPASLQAFRTHLPNVRVGIIFFQETFPRGVKLFPWSTSNYSCYIPYKAEALESPILKRLNPDIFVLEVTTLRESVLRTLQRHYKGATLALWYDKEPHPEEGFPLLERLKNEVTSPHIRHVLTKTPRQLVSYLKKQGIRFRDLSQMQVPE